MDLPFEFEHAEEYDIATVKAHRQAAPRAVLQDLGAQGLGNLAHGEASVPESEDVFPERRMVVSRTLDVPVDRFEYR